MSERAPPVRHASFEITFGRGIGKVSELLEVAIEHGHIVKGGSWYSVPAALAALDAVTGDGGEDGEGGTSAGGGDLKCEETARFKEEMARRPKMQQVR